ncbi:MAG TPA: HD domain-containing phosphohydrolase, partial [Rhodocyclaceae bacterium]|nr:HD domain-containing phosphohydrolase [Rhodocyclaceae bacterium]
MRLVPLSGSDVCAGRALRFDVYSAEGKLLLARGQRVPSAALAQRLIETAFRRIEGEPSAGMSAFRRMDGIAARLARLLAEFGAPSSREFWVRRVDNLVRDMLDAADDDPDAAFAMPHLNTHYNYDVLHHLMAALVAARLAHAVGLDAAARHSLACAGITHDVAMLAHRSAFDSVEMLSEAQREAVLHHPEAGRELLSELGVTDALWLDAVARHHEYLDGSGYPSGSRGDAQPLGGRILALADALSAMLRMRPYRERRLAADAVAELYADADGRYDPALVAALKQALGDHPPGSVVRLESREI